MIVGARPLPNTGLMPDLVGLCGFFPTFLQLTENHRRTFVTLLLFAAVGLSLISGSVWLVAITISALLINLYPALLVLAAAGCGAFFLIRYLRR